MIFLVYVRLFFICGGIPQEFNSEKLGICEMTQNWIETSTFYELSKPRHEAFGISSILSGL